MPEDVISELEQICTVLNSSVSRASQRVEGEGPALLIYAEHRGPYIAMSLHTLALASVNTAKRKPSDGPYKAGTNAIGIYSKALEDFILTEYRILTQVFKGGQQGLALQATCHSALGEYSRTLRELNDYIKANLATDRFLAFEIIQIVTGMSYRVETKTGELKSVFIEATRPIRETARIAVSDLIEDTKRKAANIPALPPDGSPVSMVSEVMDSLANLMGYSEPLASILTTLGDGNWRSRSKGSPSAPPLDVNPDSSTLLNHYALDVVETLLMVLEGRSRAFHRSKAILGVFLTNVFCIVDRSIRHSPALSRYLGTPESIARIDAFRKRATSTYLEAWRETSHFLLDVQYTSRHSSGSAASSRGPVDSSAIVKSLPSKEKDTIKDKFKSFNATFDELVVRHKSLYMEREVRGVLGREVQAIIEPLYARFYDRYHEIDKGRGKYVKYDKAALSAQLAALA